MTQANVLTLFNAIVVKDVNTVPHIDNDLIACGVVTNFVPDHDIKLLLKSKFAPLPVTTLFSVEERKASSPIDLLRKQFQHYIEVYLMETPGFFNLETTTGSIIKAVYVEGITVDELADKVRTLIYTNAPIGDAKVVVDIIKHFNIDYDFSMIKNNEVRAMVYDPAIHVFANGDDAIRYMVFLATGESMVIKNAKVINAIKNSVIPYEFFQKNEKVLAEVFNRFKPLILAAKSQNYNTNGIFAKMKGSMKSQFNLRNKAINRIARLSKTMHKPVIEGINKRFLFVATNILKEKGIADASKRDTISRLAEKLTVRDKFKIMNLIQYKKHGYTVDSIVVRNGTIHIEQNRPVLDRNDLKVISDLLVKSLSADLEHLKGKNILLDPNVNYGLPISRKQALGNLPFGTEIEVNDAISAGIYWEDEWGASDLDLSTVNMNGHRVGWGSMSGYGKSDIIFSGDMTCAIDGAMEFMTSKTSSYGLFVNVFRGRATCQFELVVGKSSENKWIEDVHVREKSNLRGRGSVIGFVQKNKFKVFHTRLDDRHANFGQVNPVICRATVDFWTVRDVLDAIGVSYDLEADSNKNYDYNLEYSNFSFDKLENMLYQ